MSAVTSPARASKRDTLLAGIGTLAVLGALILCTETTIHLFWFKLGACLSLAGTSIAASEDRRVVITTVLAVVLIRLCVAFAYLFLRAR